MTGFSRKRLDKPTSQARIPPISGKPHCSLARPTVIARVYDSNPAVATPEKRSTMNECKHPRVQIVAREEDAEFVECLECGDIFESSEFKDMMIEDTRLKKES
jgi:hypothetical protein